MNRSIARLTIVGLLLYCCQEANAQRLRRGSRVVCGPSGCFVAHQPGDVPTGASRLEVWQLNGVDCAKLKGSEDAYSRSGRACTKLEALGADLDDDSGKLWLIVTGNGRDRFLSDLRADAAMTDLLARTRVWSQAADHYSVQGKGYPEGEPGIFFALADGAELYRANSYAGPADLQAIRKADPLYKPSPVPPQPVNPNIPQPTPSPVNSLPAVIVLAACGMLIWRLKRK